MNTMKINKSHIKTIFLILFLNFSIMNTGISNYTKESLKRITNTQLFQTYFLYDNVNNTNILYTDYSFSYNYSQFDYFKMNMLWFSDLTQADFNYGAFFGIGQTKVFDNHTFSDLVICKTQEVILKCSDYSVQINNTNDVSIEFFNNFKPILDISSDGQDNILNYSASYPIYSSSKTITPFYSLLKMDVILGIESEDSGNDLNLGFENNVTVFIGNFVESESKSAQKSKYNILRVSTKNFTSLISGSFHFKLNLFLLFLIALVIA